MPIVSQPNKHFGPEQQRPRKNTIKKQVADSRTLKKTQGQQQRNRLIQGKYGHLQN